MKQRPSLACSKSQARYDDNVVGDQCRAIEEYRERINKVMHRR